MRELLDGLVPGLDGLAASAIVDRADGIPLYAIETVRMLVADGRLSLENGVYAPVGDLTSLAVPESLTALIASRLDALDTADRAIVNDAAVLGQSFTLAALSAVSGTAENNLEPRLAALVRRELLTRDVNPRSPERGQYAFVQALIREVAYKTLAKKDRKARHLAAARFFEQLGSDELAGVLAGQYLAAHENASVGPEADALAVQARLALRGAAERAVALGAHDQAIEFLEQALTVTSDPAEQADLLLRAGESATAAARGDKADTFLRQAVELSTRTGDRKAAARATAALGWSLLSRKASQAALTLLETATAEYDELWPDAVAVELKERLARAYVANEQHQRAMEVADEALVAAEHADLVPVLARLLIDKGSAFGNLGRLREAIALINAGEELARDNGLNQELLDALVIGAYHRSEIDQMAALASYREGLALARRLGQRQYVFRFVNNVGWTSFLAGDWDGALVELDAALTEDLDDPRRVHLLANALIVRALRGEQVSEGMAELERLTSDITDPDLLLQLVWARATVALVAGLLAEARSAWRRAASLSASQAPVALYEAGRSALWARDTVAAREDLAALDATGFHGRVVEARRTTLRAGLAALEVDRVEALSLYRDALRSWRDLRLPWDEALTGVTMATLLDPTEPEVRVAVDSTREILVRLRATPFLERLDAAVAAWPAADVLPVGAAAPA
jgi:tetratricopeptide (TPR) repeat protein